MITPQEPYLDMSVLEALQKGIGNELRSRYRPDDHIPHSLMVPLMQMFDQTRHPRPTSIRDGGNKADHAFQTLAIMDLPARLLANR